MSPVKKAINNGDSKRRNLPLEIIETILTLLTTQDLLKSRSVCKPWKTLIDSYTFQKSLFDSSKRFNLSTLLIWRNSAEPTLHHCYPHSDVNNNLSFELPLNLGQFLDDSAFDSSSNIMMSSSNGVDCLCFNKFGVVNGLVYLGWNSFHVVWNPCTKQFNSFNAPPKNWEFDLLDECGVCEEVLLNEICAFGFDPISKDYKFLIANFVSEMGKNASKLESSKVICQLYSVKNKSWKGFVVDFVSVSGIVTGDGYMNDGKFYWFAKKCGGSADSPGLISFDFHNEVFERVKLPEELAQGENAVAVGNRGVLEVVMTFRNGEGGKDLRGEVWSKGSDGSWRNSLTVELPSKVGRPVGLLKEGDMLFESPSGMDSLKELVLFDPATSSVKNLGFVGTKLWIFDYVQSLFSVKLST